MRMRTCSFFVPISLPPPFPLLSFFLTSKEVVDHGTSLGRPNLRRLPFPSLPFSFFFFDERRDTRTPLRVSAFVSLPPPFPLSFPPKKGDGHVDLDPSGSLGTVFSSFFSFFFPLPLFLFFPISRQGSARSPTGEEHLPHSRHFLLSPLPPFRSPLFSFSISFFFSFFTKPVRKIVSVPDKTHGTHCSYFFPLSPRYTSSGRESLRRRLM